MLFRPFRAYLRCFNQPRALPWAVVLCPFGALLGALLAALLAALLGALLAALVWGFGLELCFGSAGVGPGKSKITSESKTTTAWSRDYRSKLMPMPL